MIPRTLDEWTLPALQQLLDKAVFETDSFDFKEMLPRDDKGRTRLARECAAFANARGGFLIFGVSDDRSAVGAGRLPGIDPGFDFPASFGEYPKKCAPTLDWDFKAAPIMLPTGKVVHAVWIPPSTRAPHGIEVDGYLTYPKRTNKGVEPLSHEELRDMIARVEERKQNLLLLDGELSNIEREALVWQYQANDPRGPEEQDHCFYAEFDLTLLEQTLATVYSLLSPEPVLLGEIASLRSYCRAFNARVQYARQAVLVTPGKARNELYQFVRGTTAGIQERVKERIRPRLAPILKRHGV